MHLLQQLVADVQPQPALGISFDDAAMFPADEVGRDDGLKTPDKTRWEHALDQTPENASQADIDCGDQQVICAVVLLDLESDICDADNFTAFGVDNLLVEKIADQPQHVLVGMVRREQLVLQVDSVQGNGTNLVVPNREPSPTPT